MSGLNLLAEPAGKNLLGEEPEGMNLLEGPQADSDSGGFLGHIGNLIKNVPMVGTITPDMVPSRPVDQMALGAAGAVNTVESAWLNRPGHEPTPEEQIRLGQLKGDRRVSGGLIQEIQREDSKVAQMAGNALQSVPGSAVGLAAAPILPFAGAMAVGLGSNLLLESSGALAERMDEHGQTAAEAWPGAAAEGALATGLEVLPLGATLKYAKKAAPLGKTLLKIGGGEALQEGATQVGSDLLRNAEDLTDYSLGEMAERAGEAAVTGAMMAPIMGGAANLTRRTAELGARLRAEQKFEESGAVKELMDIALKEQAGILHGEEPLLVPEELSPEESVQAEMLREQRAQGINVEVTPRNRILGDIVDELIGENQREGRTIAREEDSVQPDSGGVTDYVLEGRERRYSPNELAPSQRPIRFAPKDESVIGLTLEQTGNLPKGSVVAIGGEEHIFPTPVYAALTSFAQSLIDKYAPDMRLILNLEQFAPEHQGTAFGLHQYKNGVHVITPRDLPGFAHQGGDQRTSVAMMTAFAHEFGHALKVHSLYGMLEQSVGEELSHEISRAVARNKLTDAHLASIEAAAPEEAGLLRTWRDTRQAVLEGKLTATEFMDSWAGMRKLAGSVSRNAGYRKGLYTWAEERLAGFGKRLEGATALELLIGKPQATTAEDKAVLQEWLKLDEYMAEQFSRAAHSAGELDQSALGRVFTTALARLRNLFKELKSWRGESGEKIILPGETFAKWLEKSTKRAGEGVWRKGKFRKSAKLRKALDERQARLEAILAEEEQENPPSPPEQVPPPSDIAGSSLDVKARLEETVDGMESSGVFYENEARLRAIRGAIKRGQFEYAKAKIEDTLGESLNWDRDYTSRVLERLPNKNKIKLETLQSYLKMQDVKADERAMWEKFMLEHPEGFSKEEAEQALAENVVPLENELSNEWAEYGLARVGLHNYSGYQGEATTVIWNGPYEHNMWNHFSGRQYLMHSRRWDTHGDRFITELQSDVFQKNDFVAENASIEELKTEIQGMETRIDFIDSLLEDAILQGGDAVLAGLERQDIEIVFKEEPSYVKLFDENRVLGDLFVKFLRIRKEFLGDTVQPLKTRLAQSQKLDTAKLASLQKTWWQRLIREEVAAAFEDGKKEVFFPTADTLAKIEGWQAFYSVPELAGKPIDPSGISSSFIFTGKVTMVDPELDYFKAVVTDGSQEVEARIIQANYPQFEEVREKILASPRDYGDMQGIYLRYKSAITKFLKSQYSAQEVEVQKDEFSPPNKWLVVNPESYGKKVLNWDRENPLEARALPGTTLTDFAGITPEDFRNPMTIAQASALWNRLKFESPFWKRWGGDTKVVKADGEPLRVWRGQGGHISFLDKAGLGGNTGVSSAKKAFWFTDNALNAEWYANSSVNKRKLVVKGEHKREQQKLRERIAEAKDLRKVASGKQKDVLQGRINRLTQQLQNLETGEEATVPAQPVVQGFYLNMVNPLVVDMGGEPYTNTDFTKTLNEAQAAGHDGVIFKNTFDPLDGTVYAIFAPEQAKLESNIGTFDPTDELHWDSDSQPQQTVRGISKLMQNFWGKGKLRAMNTAAKMVDSIIQLQQVAAAQPDDLPLQAFHRMTQSALQMKNNLQVDAEETVKKMMGLNGASPETVNTLQKVLKKEWEGDALQGMLVGIGLDGAVVWGGEAGVGKEQRALVKKWEVVDSLQLRAWLKREGIDVETEQGKQVLDLYLRVRNVFLTQWHYLERTLQDKAKKMYDESPTLYKAELWKIEGLIGKLRASPYMPQGHFGNYVLMIQAKAENKRGKVTIRKEHFEKKEDFQLAYKQAQAMVRNRPDLTVKSVELKDDDYVPMQLPRDLLEALAGTGQFDDAQIELMSELMVVPKYDKILDRYEKMALKVDGANQDFVRTFADFTLRNSNFIWKMYYGSTLRAAIAAENTEIRRLDRNKEILPTEQLEQIDRLRRNARLMEKTLAYMLHPPQEFQTARLWITLAYLAYNAKTAVMNFGTQLNTWAAVTTEYGEIAGNKYYAQGLRETASYPWLEKRLKSATGKEAQHLNEVKAVWDQAVRDGVIDQSYAYFLAGQANTAGALKTLKNSWTGRAGHVAMEVGMLPFKTVEKANRMSTLMTFYLAERGKGSNYMVAYETAVQKVNLLQNAYDAANKPELLRGKKSIAFMFASFTQFQGWMMMGGYERAMRAQARADGRAVPNVWHGTTMKLWLLYLLLGGLMGVPFAENAMDLVQWAWRRLFGRTENLEQELRELVKDVGGDPNLAMHGLLHDVGGFNLSGSFGMGRMLPGLDLLNREYRKPEEAIGKLAVGLSGPAGGFYADMAAAIGEFKEGEFRKGFMELPGATGAMSKALDAYLKQRNQQETGAAVTTKTGMRLTWDESRGEFRDLTTGELVGMALGAQLSMVSENREKHYAVQGEVLYWQTRRGDLVDKYWKAVKAGDEELREDMREEIMKFNQKIPDRKLAITGKDLAASIKARRKANQAMERYSVNGKKYRGLAGTVGDAYEAGAE